MSTEAERIEEARAQLAEEQKQWLNVFEDLTRQVAYLEAAPRTIREFVQNIADTKELRIQVEEILSTIRFFAFQEIHRFRAVHTLEEAINAYANFVFGVKDLLPEDMFIRHSTKIEHIANKQYGKIWEIPIQHGKGLKISRITMPDIYPLFYEVFWYLLRLRFLPAEEAKKTLVSFQEAAAKVIEEHGKGRDE